MYDPNLSPGIRLSTDTYTNPQLPCTVPPRAVRHHLRYKYKPKVKNIVSGNKNNLQSSRSTNRVACGPRDTMRLGKYRRKYEEVSSHTDTQYSCSKVKCERLMQLSMGKSVEPAPRHGIRKPAQHF
jgi:hypothetical protein